MVCPTAPACLLKISLNKMAPCARAELAAVDSPCCNSSVQPPCAETALPFASGGFCTLDTNSGSSSDSDAPSVLLDGPASVSKSAKRRAAEALLERKASRQRLDMQDAPFSAPSRLVSAQACESSSCSTLLGAAQRPAGRWCGMPVAIPSVDWPNILRNLSAAKGSSSREGSQLPEGIDIRLVETTSEIAPALAALRASMVDSIVAIDLEWKPDYLPRSNNRVALIQLATATTCILLRTCRMGWALPAALQHFFR